MSKTNNSSLQFYKFVTILNDKAETNGNIKLSSLKNSSNNKKLFESFLPNENKMNTKINSLFNSFDSSNSKIKKNEILVDSIGAYFLNKGNSATNNNNKIVNIEQKYSKNLGKEEKLFISKIFKMTDEQLVIKSTNIFENKTSKSDKSKVIYELSDIDANSKNKDVNNKKIVERNTNDSKKIIPLTIDPDNSKFIYPALNEINDIISSSKFGEIIFLKGSKLANIIDGVNLLVKKSKVDTLQISKKESIDFVNKENKKDSVIIEIKPILVKNNKLSAESNISVIGKKNNGESLNTISRNIVTENEAVTTKNKVSQSLRVESRNKNDVSKSDKVLLYQLSKLTSASGLNNTQGLAKKSMIVEKEFSTDTLSYKLVGTKSNKSSRNKNSMITLKSNDSKIIGLISKEISENLDMKLDKANNLTNKEIDSSKSKLLENSSNIKKLTKETIGIINRINKLQSNNTELLNLNVKVDFIKEDNQINKLSFKITPVINEHNTRKVVSRVIPPSSINKSSLFEGTEKSSHNNKFNIPSKKLNDSNQQDLTKLNKTNKQNNFNSAGNLKNEEAQVADKSNNSFSNKSKTELANSNNKSSNVSNKNLNDLNPQDSIKLNKTKRQNAFNSDNNSNDKAVSVDDKGNKSILNKSKTEFLNNKSNNETFNISNKNLNYSNSQDLTKLNKTNKLNSINSGSNLNVNEVPVDDKNNKSILNKLKTDSVNINIKSINISSKNMNNLNPQDLTKINKINKQNVINSGGYLKN